jgi:hypothetical protein
MGDTALIGVSPNAQAADCRHHKTVLYQAVARQRHITRNTV